MLLYISLGPGAYGLVEYRVKPGLIPQMEHRLLQNFSELNYNPLGMFYTAFGDVNSGEKCTIAIDTISMNS